MAGVSGNLETWPSALLGTGDQCPITIRSDNFALSVWTLPVDQVLLISVLLFSLSSWLIPFRQPPPELSGSTTTGAVNLNEHSGSR